MEIRLSVIFVLFFVLVLHAFADYTKGLDAYLKEDYATALKEFKPLAEKGNAEAQAMLSYMYRSGKGVLGDDVEAVKWSRQAAEQGYAPAQTSLGVRYKYGIGVSEDDVEAVKWYRLAAEQGYAIAQYFLGEMYANGEGIPEDVVSAYMWWNIVSSLGDKHHSENAKERKDEITKEMTSSEIEKAQELSKQYLNADYKDCE